MFVKLVLCGVLLPSRIQRILFFYVQFYFFITLKLSKVFLLLIQVSKFSILIDFDHLFDVLHFLSINFIITLLVVIN